MKILTLLILLCTYFHSLAQRPAIDVTQYALRIELSDSSDIINVEEQVFLSILDSSSIPYLDLYALDASGLGMSIDPEYGVRQNNEGINYYLKDNKLYFKPQIRSLPEELVLSFHYSGIPKTGLIISSNKFSERTFFGDNWPNRAHHWIACNDHPSDKAKIQFTVNAPEHYDCVATGSLTSSELIMNRRSTVFHSDYNLPTKVMVIGLADFCTKTLSHEFPLMSWVYRRDSLAISDLDCSKEILDYFTENIAIYPYEKLFNVQSTTQFGGMENAGNIFYDEGAFSGKGKMEALVAHEIAHQWFGNSASESDWKDLWLSEGFATYFTDLYWENKYGTDELRKRLSGERAKVVAFSKSYKHPVRDTTYSELMDLLNPNSYQKGAWVLHMLRKQIGDELFWEVIRTYYDDYKYANASTEDFIATTNRICGKDLGSFFNQWLYQFGHPVLSVEFSSKKKKHSLQIVQVQEQFVFNFPLEVELIYTDNTSDTVVLEVNSSNYTHRFCTDKKVKDIKLDPAVNLLFEEQKKSLH